LSLGTPYGEQFIPTSASVILGGLKAYQILKVSEDLKLLLLVRKRSASQDMSIWAHERGISVILSYVKFWHLQNIIAKEA